MSAADATAFNFGVQIDYKVSKKCKIRGQRSRGLGHVPNFLLFWDHSIAETAEATKSRPVKMQK